MTWASFLSLSISSSTDDNMIPAFLFGGSVTSTTSKSGFTSTFNSCGVNFFMGFDFAFIMFGSVAYLGWFSLKSVLHHKQKQWVPWLKIKIFTSMEFFRQLVLWTLYETQHERSIHFKGWDLIFVLDVKIDIYISLANC